MRLVPSDALYNNRWKKKGDNEAAKGAKKRKNME